MTDDPSKNGQERASSGQFVPGHPGGPGRPAGSRSSATLLLDEMADGDGEAILRKVIAKAKEGDSKSAEIILARVWPARKGRRVSFSMPPIETPKDIVAGISAIIAATASGELVPDEAALIAGPLETKRKAIETLEIEERLARLEAKKP